MDRSHYDALNFSWKMIVIIVIFASISICTCAFTCVGESIQMNNFTLHCDSTPIKGVLQPQNVTNAMS